MHLPSNNERVKGRTTIFRRKLFHCSRCNQLCWLTHSSNPHTLCLWCVYYLNCTMSILNLLKIDFLKKKKERERFYNHKPPSPRLSSMARSCEHACAMLINRGGSYIFLPLLKIKKKGGVRFQRNKVLLF